MRFLYPYICALSMIVLAATPAAATHLRAGEITARRISSTELKYEFTLTTYSDNQNGRPADDAANDYEFYFGSIGPIRVERVPPRVTIPNNTTRNRYVATFTFSAPGRYTISALCINRNVNTINLAPQPTDQINFFIETIIVINAQLGLNQTPVLLNAPIDLARTGQRFVHNPGAFDADGDSLAYRMTRPKKGEGGRGVFIDYKDPALGVDPTAKTEDGNAAAFLQIDPITGTLTWDAPAVRGQYNVAFIVEEWRNGVKIGEITRDMQILVDEGNRNDRPNLDPMPDLCVEAGTLVQQRVRASDKNGDRLILSAVSGVFSRAFIAPDSARFIVTNPQANPAVATFEWRTNCAHVRDEPYDVLVKVEDTPAVGEYNPNTFRRLADLKTFKIKVYAPAPKNLNARLSTGGRLGFELNWDSYTACASDPRSQMIIYRKEGCSNFKPSNCDVGLAASLGYREIARVPIGTTTFLDADPTIKRGVQYSYRIVAVFPQPTGGQSVVSTETCLDSPNQLPVMTNVTVDSTSTTRGQITVRWTRPLGFTATQSEQPYQYRLLRATGLAGNDFAEIARINTRLDRAADTVFVDRGLNTQINAYRYKIDFYFTDANKNFSSLGLTEPASSVLLSVGGSNRALVLNWQANTPWNNDGQRHKVFRQDATGRFNQIADVAVAGTYTYTDDGTDRFLADGNATIPVTNDRTYCYRVETVGTFNNPRIPIRVTNNLSQITCASPVDTTRPCTPELKVDIVNCADLADDALCGQTSLTNTLTWTNPEKNARNENCPINIAKYNIYFARYEDQKLELIGSVAAPANTFRHTGLASWAGCYQITAVNRFNGESALSNKVCKDNCPSFKLPNVLTPNGDGRNDVFRPMNCARFAKTVLFRVYTRQGVQVFETTDLQLNWNGTSSDGKELATGTYYYECLVTFERLERETAPVLLKGWVQLLR